MKRLSRTPRVRDIIFIKTGVFIQWIFNLKIQFTPIIEDKERLLVVHCGMLMEMER